MNSKIYCTTNAEMSLMLKMLLKHGAGFELRIEDGIYVFTLDGTHCYA